MGRELNSDIKLNSEMISKKLGELLFKPISTTRFAKYEQPDDSVEVKIENYEEMVFFSEGKKKEWDEMNPDVRKSCLFFLRMQIRETKKKINQKMSEKIKTE